MEEKRGDETHDTQEMMTSLKTDENVSKDCENTKTLENDNELINTDKNTDISVQNDPELVGDTNIEDGENVGKCRLLSEGDTLSSDILEEESDEDEDNDDDDDDDNDDGWITPSNIKSMKERMGDVNTQKADVPVGCLTTDFAIQVNVPYFPVINPCSVISPSFFLTPPLTSGVYRS